MLLASPFSTDGITYQQSTLLCSWLGRVTSHGSQLHVSVSLYLRSRVPDTTSKVLFIHCQLLLNKTEAKHRIALHL